MGVCGVVTRMEEEYLLMTKWRMMKRMREWDQVELKEDWMAWIQPRAMAAFLLIPLPNHHQLCYNYY